MCAFSFFSLSSLKIIGKLICKNRTYELHVHVTQSTYIPTWSCFLRYVIRVRNLLCLATLIDPSEISYYYTSFPFSYHTVYCVFNNVHFHLERFYFIFFSFSPTFRAIFSPNEFCSSWWFVMLFSSISRIHFHSYRWNGHFCLYVSYTRDRNKYKDGNPCLILCGWMHLHRDTIEKNQVVECRFGYYDRKRKKKHETLTSIKWREWLEQRNKNAKSFSFVVMYRLLDSFSPFACILFMHHCRPCINGKKKKILYNGYSMQVFMWFKKKCNRHGVEDADVYVFEKWKHHET